MKFRSLISFSTIALLAACATTVEPEVQEPPKELPEEVSTFTGTSSSIDLENSHISFIGKSNIINHEGKFEKFDATLTLDDTDPADLELASIDAVLDATSITADGTGVEGHLQREDFFNTEVYPEITFESSKIVHIEGDSYEITGDLTIKDTTKEVTLDAEITDESILIEYDLPRQDFGVGNDSYGDKLLDPLVPVEVKLMFE